MTHIETKYFTPKEAIKTLPLVKSIVKDILRCGNELKEISETSDENIKNNNKIRTLILEMQKYMEELEELGCSFKDWNFTIGLVDFPSIIDGEEVLLCWKSDEETIKYYHTEEKGYSGRKPIPDIYFY
ncbi:MAG TPA: DUF2203 domain-containing protein [Melioribacteraceae bacterium]|nr:DUF2203 domain-containing protein [Melioribacteraceae bacterium]